MKTDSNSVSKKILELNFFDLEKKDYIEIVEASREKLKNIYINDKLILKEVQLALLFIHLLKNNKISLAEQKLFLNNGAISLKEHNNTTILCFVEINDFSDVIIDKILSYFDRQTLINHINENIYNTANMKGIRFLSADNKFEIINKYLKNNEVYLKSNFGFSICLHNLIEKISKEDLSNNNLINLVKKTIKNGYPLEYVPQFLCEYIDINYPHFFSYQELMQLAKFKKLPFKEKILQNLDFINEYVCTLDIFKISYLYSSMMKANAFAVMKEFKKSRNKFLDYVFDNKNLIDFLEIFIENYNANILPDEKRSLPFAMANLFCERFAGDLVKNTMLNCETIYNYMKSNQQYKNNLENSELIAKIYIALKNVEDNVLPENKLIEDVKNLYLVCRNNNLNLEEILYDALTLGKEMFMKDVNKSLTNIKELNFSSLSHISKDINDDNIKYYEFNGDKFEFLVHCTNDSKDASNYCYDHWVNYSSRNKVISLSLISDTRQDVYDSSKIMLAFENLNPKLMMHACVVDSYSISSKSEDFVPTSVSKMDLLSVDDFFKSMGYEFNEIVYDGSSEFLKQKLMPSAVITFETPKESEKFVAQKFNIPIIKINKLAYEPARNSDRRPLDSKKSFTDYGILF